MKDVQDLIKKEEVQDPVFVNLFTLTKKDGLLMMEGLWWLSSLVSC